MALIPRRLMAAIRPEQTKTQDFLDKAAAPDTERNKRYALATDYYEGRHRTLLTDRLKRFLEQHQIRFCENFCDTIIDVYAERLTVTGVSSSIPPEKDEKTGQETRSDVDEWLDMVLERNRFDATQTRTHLHGILKGDAFVIVDWDDDTQRPVFVFNRPEIVKCYYSDDDPDVIEWASKRWNTEGEDGRKRQRLNVYWPDRVEKWVRQQADKGGWDQHQDEGESVWPTPWLRPNNEPRGVPVFHFRHKPVNDTYGRSELDSTIPQQDLLNKLVIDFATISDNYSEPSRWATGVDPSSFDTEDAPGAWKLTNTVEAKFGQFETADVDKLTKGIEEVISRMARRSRTPMHLLTSGDMPSGEALKSAEAGLVAKVQALHTPWGNVWEDVMKMTVLLAVDAGVLSLPVDEAELTLSTEWKDPQSRNEKTEAEAAEIKHGLGVSKRTLLSELGYDPDEEEENREREAEQGAEVFATLFDRGGGQLAGGFGQRRNPDPLGGGGTA